METEEVIKLVDGIYKVSPSQLLSFLQSGLRMGSKDGTEDSLDEIGEILCCLQEQLRVIDICNIYKASANCGSRCIKEVLFDNIQSQLFNPCSNINWPECLRCWGSQFKFLIDQNHPSTLWILTLINDRSLSHPYCGWKRKRIPLKTMSGCFGRAFAIDQLRVTSATATAMSWRC